MTAASPTDVISNWSCLIENLQTSPLGFFESVERAIQKRAIPDTKSSRVDYHEGGVLSAKREYLRINRGKLIFDICAAPYGTGFFVSWWLGKPRVSVSPLAFLLAIVGYLVLMDELMSRIGFFLGFLISIALVPATLVVLRYCVQEGALSDEHVLSIPIIGYLYKKLLRPDTYYAMDTETMFRTATHAAVLEAMDALLTDKGLRALSETERRPTIRELMAS